MACRIEALKDDQIKPEPMFQQAVIYRDVQELRTNPRHARRHDKAKIDSLVAALREYRVITPLLVDADGLILSGHARLAAAKVIGLRAVPVMELSHLSEAQKRAYVIADNKLAERAGWDRAQLALEFQALRDLDFDVTLTGFDIAEIDITIDLVEGTAADEVPPEPDGGPPVTQPGDLWLLGGHRIFCGSALEGLSYERLMPGERAAMAFTDPPYNVPIAGHVSGTGRHAEFAMASGEMSAASFTSFLATAFGHMVAALADGAIAFVCMDWRHMREVLAAAETTFSELKNLVVWDKNNGGMGSLYRSKHEMVFVFKAGSASSINNVQLGRHGRNRANVWSYPGQNTFHRGRDQDLADHPTVKPLALVADAIKDVSRRGALVLDPFGGAGTTLIAAETTGRKARLIELEPKYVDVTVRRWQALTGGTARREADGASFDDLRAAVRDTTASDTPATAVILPFPGTAPEAPDMAPHAAPRRRRTAKSTPAPKESRHDAA